jgi:hypothetical protein
MAVIDSTDQYAVVQVINKSSRPFRGKHAKKWYDIDADQMIFVPLAAAMRWFGNPVLVDTPGDKRRRPRSDEYARLRVLYGAYENDDRWEANKPNCEVYTLTGERITTVVEDPYGDLLKPQDIQGDQLAIMAAQVATLSKQLKAVLAHQATLTGQLEAQEDSDATSDANPLAPTPSTSATAIVNADGSTPGSSEDATEAFDPFAIGLAEANAAEEAKEKAAATREAEEAATDADAPDVVQDGPATAPESTRTTRIRSTGR